MQRSRKARLQEDYEKSETQEAKGNGTRLSLCSGQFKMVHLLSEKPVGLPSPNAALKNVLTFVWCTMIFRRPFILTCPYDTSVYMDMGVAKRSFLTHIISIPFTL